MTTGRGSAQPGVAPPDQRGGVLLLHGFFGLPPMMMALAADLRQSGFLVDAPYYPSWRRGLGHIVDHLAPRLERLVRSAPGPVHMIGHSMGGIVARALIAQMRPPALGRVVMLGTPNGGSEIADWVAATPLAAMVLGAAGPALVTSRAPDFDRLVGSVDYDVGVIAGSRSTGEGPIARLLPAPHDGKVSVAATHLRGQRDHIVLPVPHRLLPFDREARRQSLAFLATGSFDR